MKIFSQLAALLLLLGYVRGEVAAIRGATTAAADATDAVTPVEKVRSPRNCLLDTLRCNETYTHFLQFSLT